MSKKTYLFKANVMEYVDQDYKHELSEEDTLWLKTFNNEYYGTAYGNESSLHSTGIDNFDKRTMHSKANAENRDVYSISKCSDLLSFIPDLSSFQQLDSSSFEEDKGSPEYLIKIDELENLLSELLDKTLKALNKQNFKSDKKEILKKFLKKGMRLLTVNKKILNRNKYEKYKK